MTTICRDWFSGTARSARDSGKFEKQKEHAHRSEGGKSKLAVRHATGVVPAAEPCAHARPPLMGDPAHPVPIHWLACNAGQISSWRHALPFPPLAPRSRPACLGPARSGVSGKPYRRLSRNKGAFDGGERTRTTKWRSHVEQRWGEEGGWEDRSE